MAACLRKRGHVLTGGAGWTPQSITGLQLWLKADAIVGLSDGDPVATWADSSGQGHDATQGTPSKQPLWKPAIRNGLAVVRFDGSDDALGVTGLTARAAQTVFIAGTKNTAPTAAHKSFYALDAAAAATVKCNSALDATRWMWQLNQAGGRTALTAATANSWLLSTALVASAASLTHYVNGGSATTLDPNDAVTTGTAISLGAAVGDGTQACDVDIGEFLMYDTALSALNQALVEAYLLAKWALP